MRVAVPTKTRYSCDAVFRFHFINDRLRGILFNGLQYTTKMGCTFCAYVSYFFCLAHVLGHNGNSRIKIKTFALDDKIYTLAFYFDSDRMDGNGRQQLHQTIVMKWVSECYA